MPDNYNVELSKLNKDSYFCVYQMGQIQGVIPNDKVL